MARTNPAAVVDLNSRVIHRPDGPKVLSRIWHNDARAPTSRFVIIFLVPSMRCRQKFLDRSPSSWNRFSSVHLSHSSNRIHDGERLSKSDASLACPTMGSSIYQSSLQRYKSHDKLPNNKQCCKRPMSSMWRSWRDR